VQNKKKNGGKSVLIVLDPIFILLEEIQFIDDDDILTCIEIV
jgi:hypothetical protein